MIKIANLKYQIYQILDVNCTLNLKKKYPSLVQDRDLRYKKSWKSILSDVMKSPKDFEDVTLEKLEKSHFMIKNSFFKIKKMSGMNDKDIEIEWHRICLESQFSDILLE
jgi:hypothetical protein